MRKARGYSQQQLADIAHVEQSPSKRLELRQLAPTLDLLISPSRALGLEVRDLVDDPAYHQLRPGGAGQQGRGAPLTLTSC